MDNDQNQRNQKTRRGEQEEQKHRRIPIVSDKKIAAEGSWLGTELRVQRSEFQEQLLQEEGGEP